MNRLDRVYSKLLILAALFVLGCGHSRPKTVTLIFSNGFVGKFEVRAAPKASGLDREVLRTRQLRFSPNGIVLLTRKTIASLFGDWTEIKAKYEDGTEITYYDADKVSGPKISRLSVDGNGSFEGFVQIGP